MSCLNCMSLVLTIEHASSTCVFLLLALQSIDWLCVPDQNKEEEEVESWQQRAACVLFKSGNKILLSALADSMANGTPSLARASLITISWMSSCLHLVEDRNLPPMAFSILTPQLLQSLNYDKDVEERVLASYSLLCLIKNSGTISTNRAMPNFNFCPKSIVVLFMFSNFIFVIIEQIPIKKKNASRSDSYFKFEWQCYILV